MDRFIARENVKHLRKRLASAIDQATRAQVTKLLVDEEDRLGRSVELIADVEREIAMIKALIAERQALIASVGRYTGRGAQLEDLAQTLALHEGYHKGLLRTPASKEG